MIRRCIRLLSLLMALLVIGTLPLGCTPALLPIQNEARTEGVARVTLESIKGDTFVFMVWNETSEPLTVDREAVLLVTPRGGRHWDAGWMRRFVVVPPGGVHDVKIKFPLGGLNEGEEIEVDFSSAVVSRGQPVSGLRLTMRVGG